MKESFAITAESQTADVVFLKTMQIIAFLGIVFMKTNYCVYNNGNFTFKIVKNNLINKASNANLNQNQFGQVYYNLG